MELSAAISVLERQAFFFLFFNVTTVRNKIWYITEAEMKLDIACGLLDWLVAVCMQVRKR